MIDGIPEVSDFGAREGTPVCPRCGTMMDRGTLSTDHTVHYVPSQAPRLLANSADIDVLACIGCGHVELAVDPVEVRCILAGVKPPKRDPRAGML